MEARDLLLLSIVEDGPGAGSCWRMMQDVWQQSLVHLSLIKATQHKEDVGAEALGDVSFMTEQAGETINKPTIRQELSYSHQIQQPLK